MTRALRRWWRSTTAIALFIELRIRTRRIERSRQRHHAALRAYVREVDIASRVSRFGAVHGLFTMHGRGL